MATTRSLTRTFKIKAAIMGLPPRAREQGKYSTRDKGLIAMLRRMPDSKAEEIIEIDFDERTADASIGSDELTGLTWHEIQKLGAEKGVLKTGMGREEIEQAIRG